MCRPCARADGFRGAVLLRPGRYRVGGRLEMRASGVVLRGSGNATIVAAGKGRRTLIEIGSRADPATGAPVRIVDETVPAGGRTLTLESLAGLQTGRPHRDHAPEHGGVDRGAPDARPPGQLRQSTPGLGSRIAQPGLGPDGHAGGCRAQSDHR